MQFLSVFSPYPPDCLGFKSVQKSRKKKIARDYFWTKFEMLIDYEQNFSFPNFPKNNIYLCGAKLT